MTSTYRNFARKYRPETFAEMAGQETVTRTLSNSLRLGRVAHAYLFYGPRGCGKTTTARVLAKALNCLSNPNGPAPEPCGKCRPCIEIAQGADMDVLELDAASNTQVEKIREVILDTVALSPARDRYKIFILDEVHMLSTSSFNALLKTVEEPPPHVVFILATTERHKVPATILSRCQSFRIKPFLPEAIAAHLAHIAGAEKIDISPEALAFIAKSAGGVMRDAHTLLDRAVSFAPGRIEVASIAEMMGSTPEELIRLAMTALLARDGVALHAVFRRVNAEGFEAPTLLRDLRNSFSELFFYQLDPAGGEPFSGAAAISKNRQGAELANFARRIGRLIDETKFSDTPSVAAEVGLFTLMEAVPDIDGFIKRMEALEARLSNAPDAAPRHIAPPPAHKAELPSPAAAPFVPSRKPQPVQDAPQFVLPPKSAQPAPQKSAFHLPPKPGAQAAPVAAAPVAAAVAPKSHEADGVVWKKLLDLFSTKHPLIHDLLKDAHVEFSPNAWKISVAEGFIFKTLERNLPVISTELKELAGRDIALSLAQAARRVAAHIEEITGGSPEASVFSEEEPLAAGTGWQDIDSPAAPIHEDPAVHKVTKLFRGKVINPNLGHSGK